MKIHTLSEYPMLLGEVVQRADARRHTRAARVARARARREAFETFLDSPLATVLLLLIGTILVLAIRAQIVL